MTTTVESGERLDEPSVGVVPRLTAGRIALRVLAFAGLLCLFLAASVIPIGIGLKAWHHAHEGSESSAAGTRPATTEPEMRIDDPAVAGIEFVALVAVLLATRIAMRRDRLSWASVGLERYRVPWQLALGLATGLASFALVPIVAQKLGWATITTPPPGAAAIDSLLPALPLLLFAGAFEEIALRGYPLTMIASRSVPVAVIVTSALFAVLHLPNPSAGPMAALGVFVPGVVLALVRLRTGALWVPIGWHLGWNLAQGWLFGCEVSGMPPARAPLLVVRFHGPPLAVGGAFGPESGLLAVGADLVTFAAFLILVRRAGAGAGTPAPSSET